MAEHDSFIQSAREILARMVAVGKNVSVYPAGHPMVLGPAEDICEILKTISFRRERITFHIVDSEIYIEQRLLREESLKYSEFIKTLSGRGINSLTFEVNAAAESIAGFFSLVNRTLLSEEELLARMREEGITEIRFESLVSLDLAETNCEIEDGEEPAQALRTSYDQALKCMQSLEQDVLANRPVDVEGLGAVVAGLVEDFLHNNDALLSILNIKNYSEYLFHHSVNVAIMSLLLASKLGLSAEFMKAVGLAGLLHDIGKLKVPREITNKAGMLTDDEWLVMKRHPIDGAQILMRNESLGEIPVLAALEHHACYDLSGYPTLKGKERPHVISRIVNVTDVYEALTARRSYRVAQELTRAMRFLIEGAGKQFDPMVVKLLVNTIGAFPPGSKVKLKSGDLAVVVEPNEDQPFFPKVRLASAGSTDSADSPLTNIAEAPDRYAVVGVADSPEI